MTTPLPPGLTASPPSLWPGGFLKALASLQPPLVFDASVREEHGQQWTATLVPIEGGAKVTDHVQGQPVQLTVDAVFTDHPDAIILPKFNRAQELYGQLLAVGNTREAFDFVTSLKFYSSMVFTSISTPRTVESGSALVITMVMREIEIGTVDQVQVLTDAAIAMALGSQNLGNVSPTGALDASQSVPVV